MNDSLHQEYREHQSSEIEYAPVGSIDRFTGLPDMERFIGLATRGADAISKCGERPALVALDLIGLKAYNTQYGRSEGDRLLKLFAKVLREHFGGEACSRFAEDHFYAFASEVGLPERLEALFDDFKNTSEMQTLPVRAGVYVFDPGDDIVSVAIDRAKIACDSDRKTWQSHAVWYNDAMREEERLRIYVLEHVDQAIDKGWLRPYYQAVVRSATGDLCGEEALARWIDPEYGALSPAQFIPVLEEAGLLYKLDMHMVDCVLADMKVKKGAGVLVAPVSVNFSHRDLSQIDIAAEVSRRADEMDVPHCWLRVEFTESAVTVDPVRFKDQLDRLHAAGFEVWMDDFGSGYSSLNTLQEFDFDLIKLDMGFVAESANERTQTVISGVVQMAQQLGIGVLAEGVETQEQALFLEGVGCGLLQGYLYSAPLPLDDVIDRFKRNEGRRREDLRETGYWNVISKVNLVALAKGEGRWSVEELHLAELPVGVLELRRGKWRVLRANGEYKKFLKASGILPEGFEDLRVNPIKGELDEEFLGAVAKCAVSGDWVEIASHLEYGTGLHFRVKPIASTSAADAYLVASAPAVLGSGLGLYGDVPIAYAVFRAVFDEAQDAIVDVNFVYANDICCEWNGFERSSIIGRSFLETFGNTETALFAQCYRAVKLGENMHNVAYSPDIGHWINYYLAPSSVEGCCVFAYAIADDERRRQQEVLVNLDSADIIIEAMNYLYVMDDYQAAVNGALDMIAKILNPEHMRIFEVGKRVVRNTFEWCAEGVAPEIDDWVDLPTREFYEWMRLFDKVPFLLVPDVETLKADYPDVYRWFSSRGIARFMAVSFYDDGQFVGYLGVDNYTIEEGVNTDLLFKTVSTFIGDRIAHRTLLSELEWSSTHDSLTELFNRHGSDEAIDQYLEANPGKRYAVALVDIDNFKTMNDLHGHAVGDQALRVMADAMKQVFPKEAILGRNGGDEFLIMFPEQYVGGIDDLLAAFCADELVFEWERKSYRFTASIGYAVCPDQAVDLKDVYSKADAALYAVKLAGKFGFRRYSADLESQYRWQLGFTPRDIAENVPGAILVHRAGGYGDILFANDELVEMFGCETPSDFMEYTGGTFKGIVHPDDSVRVYTEIVSQVGLDDIGAKDFIDYRIIAKDGVVKNVAQNGRLVDVEGIGKVFYVLIVDRDERGARK